MLTIFIPTFSRSYFLTRKLHNFVAQSCRHKILILDSSPQAIAQQNARVVKENQKHLDIEYRLLGTEIHFAQKIGMGIESIATPYTIMSFDDDFLNLNFVDKALSYLETHPKTVSASGLIANFVRPLDSSFPVQRVPIPGKSEVFDDSDALVRIERFLVEKRLRNPLFNLWRSNILKPIFRPIGKAPWRKYGEILFDHAATYAGPSILLNGLFEIHNIDYQKEKYRGAGLPNFRAGIASELADANFSSVFAETIDICSQLLETDGYGDRRALREIVGNNWLKFRTRSDPLSYGPKTLCEKLKKATPFLRFIRSGRRLLSLALNCRSPARIKVIWKLISLHGRSITIDMIQNDPELRINYFTLMSTASPDHSFVASVYETLTSHPES